MFILNLKLIDSVSNREARPVMRLSGLFEFQVSDKEETRRKKAGFRSLNEAIRLCIFRQSDWVWQERSGEEKEKIKEVA